MFHCYIFFLTLLISLKHDLMVAVLILLQQKRYFSNFFCSEIPEGCPPINPDSVGICGGNICSSDNECWLYSRQTKCCPSACGGNLCTAPYGLYNARFDDFY